VPHDVLIKLDTQQLDSALGVSGVVSMTSSYELLLAVLPDGLVEELVVEVHAREVSVPVGRLLHGVSGLGRR
jgi:hypothetical protein